MKSVTISLMEDPDISGTLYQPQLSRLVLHWGLLLVLVHHVAHRLEHQGYPDQAEHPTRYHHDGPQHLQVGREETLHPVPVPRAHGHQDHAHRPHGHPQVQHDQVHPLNYNWNMLD